MMLKIDKISKINKEKLPFNLFLSLILLLILNIFEKYLLKNSFNGNKNINNTIKHKINDQNNIFYKKNRYFNNTIQNEIINDFYYIRSYKGGKLEPEWEWVKNISLVYTWVDGYDVDFQNLKSKYNGGDKENESRFRSADELRYSLRSVEKYMPWHQGNIYILTCQQIPKWLNTDHPRIKVVYHKDIFPKYAYPTFDSGTIELFLDKIPGVTERFIYFNDDFFLNNYVHPSYFFTSKGFYPKIYKNDYLTNLSKNEVKEFKSKEKGMFKVMSYNTKELIKIYFDSEYQYYHLHHFGYVFYRDLMEPFRQLFSEELKVFYFDRFRNWSKPHSLYLYLTFMEYATQNGDYLTFKGNGKSKYFKNYKLPYNRTVENYQVEVIPNSMGRQLIRYSKISNYSDKNQERFDFINSHPNILVYNFNDEYDNEKSLYELTNFMMEKYPYESSFEKKKYMDLESHYYNKINLIENLKDDLTTSLSTNYYGNKKFIFDEKMYIFDSVIKEYKLTIIKEYLDKKKKLSGPEKEMSDNERKEIDILLNYKGNSLDENWRWVENISLVYILENSKPQSHSFSQLKYSLRSVDQYLPWFKGNIYIVTQNEIQNELSWLNLNHSRIKVINQNEIIPDTFSNTTNKWVIEMFLDKIPGITEKFIYLKNNHYFIKYVHPIFFFNEKYYPKYNFNKPLDNKKLEKQKNGKTSFFYTYSVISKYFGKEYINSIRYLKNTPYALYRDLFEPTRQLYEDYLYNMKLLPLHILATYNIYATNQPFYPNYVSGYGLIRNSKLPILEKNRTIRFYGYDITSPLVHRKTILSEMIFNDKTNSIEIIINKILSSNKLFFSFKLNKIYPVNFENLLSKLFSKKAKFES